MKSISAGLTFLTALLLSSVLAQPTSTAGKPPLNNMIILSQAAPADGLEKSGISFFAIEGKLDNASPDQTRVQCTISWVEGAKPEESKAVCQAPELKAVMPRYEGPNDFDLVLTLTRSPSDIWVAKVSVKGTLQCEQVPFPRCVSADIDQKPTKHEYITLNWQKQG